VRDRARPLPGRLHRPQQRDGRGAGRASPHHPLLTHTDRKGCTHRQGCGPCSTPERSAVPTITGYSRPACVQCDATYRMLDRPGLDYPTVDGEQDAEALAYVRSLGYLAAPVDVAGDQHWSGYRPDELKALAARINA